MSGQSTYSLDEQELRLRDATASDAADLAIFADAATRRLVSWIWDYAADPGQSSFEIGVRTGCIGATDSRSAPDERSCHSRVQIRQATGS